MLKENFVAPTIFLLALAVTYLGITAYFIYEEIGVFGANLLRSLQIYWYVSTLLWPVLMLTEAFVYWRIRKRNPLRKASWSHVCLFAFAYLSFFLKGGLISVVARIESKQEFNGFIEIVSRIQLLIFWLSIIGGHIFFIRVLRMARAQKHIQTDTDPANLLDDVLS